MTSKKKKKKNVGSATSNKRHARYLSDHPPFLGSPRDEIGKTIPTQSSQRKEHTPLARVLELPTCPSLPFHVIMSAQEVLSIVIENRYQSITARIFAIDCLSIININRLIDIDW